MDLRYLLKAMILPPGPQLLGLALSWLLWRWRPRLSRWLLGLSFGSLLLLSLPICSGWLMKSLEHPYRPIADRELKAAQAIVVLGGGRQRDALEYFGDTVNPRTLERLRYGAHLYEKHPLPILLSGGSVRRAELVPEAELMSQVMTAGFKVPVTWLESRSRTTAENAELSAQVLRQEGIGTVVLITQAWHMRRAEAAFRKAGLTVVPAPVALQGPADESDGDGWRRYVVSPQALLASSYALHEWLGYWVYWLQGRV